MEIAALIVAAGMSSRMGDFKPMLNIGSISIAKRVVANFTQAGVGRIVVITGFNAEELEHHLANCGVIFLRNENYETTDMFDSVRIGLDYLKDKSDAVLFTPVDIPLFTVDTLNRLISSGAKLASPCTEGRTGHPVLISSSLIPEILADDGAGGLKGALSRCGCDMQLIEVDDLGILHDADTPEDYAELLKLHNRQLIRPELEIRLSREVSFFDDRLCMLLQLIDETGSVRSACQRMQISYSTGWNLIRTLETQLKRTIVVRTQGGSGGGQSALSEYGKNLLDCYMKFRDDVTAYANDAFTRCFSTCLNELY